MNLTVLNNGDIQVGDYKFRISRDHITVVWYLTERCNFKCSYCVGWHNGGRDCLSDKYFVEEIVNHFRYLQDNSEKKLYIWLTGGEPSIVTNFSELVRQLTNYMDIELQTNLCTKHIKDFAKNVDPKRVGEVMATYHGEILDRNDSLRKLYFENFKLLMNRGFTVVLKMVAFPKEIPDLRDKVAWLKRQLPNDAIILIQPFIAGTTGPKEHPNSYPYCYTEEEKRILQEVIQVRRTEIFDYINGAGWFQGMKCDAGKGFIAMDKNGDVFRCVHDLVHKQNSLGNLVKKNISLLDVPKPCQITHCSAPFWALWYGINPWDYIGKNPEDCRYCRFAPSHLKDTNKVDPKGTKIRKFYGKANIQISAIICTINRASYLKKAIKSLIDQTLPKDHYEIIVVDNGSTDDTKTIVKNFKHLANLRYIYEPIMGLSHARNIGWQNSQGRYMAFLDDDAIACPEWLERIVETFETVRPQPGSVGGKVIPIWEVNRPVWLPKELERSLTIIDWTDKPTFLTEEHHYLAGTNIAYTQQILQECGGFSTDLGRKGGKLLSGEEILMKKYLQSRNLESYYDPKIYVWHHVPSERVRKHWFYRRSFWQGISSEILQYLNADKNEVEWRYLSRAIANTVHLFRDRKNLALIFMPSNSSNEVVRKCDIYGCLGRICAQMQIGFGMGRNRQTRLQKGYYGMRNFALAFRELSFRALMGIRKQISNVPLIFSLIIIFMTNRSVYHVIKRVFKDKLTYLEVSALIDLYKNINDLKSKKSDGIIIETGCALGGSSLVMAASKEQIRPFYFYDAFGMIPPPSELDGDDAHERYRIIVSGESKGCGKNKYYGYERNLLDKVRQAFCDYGLPPNKNNVYLIKGLFMDTLFVNEPVALAHIDCDWYESVMTCLQRIEPNLIKGGILIIDDYYTWSGCRKAVDDYFSDKKNEFKFIKKSRLHIIRR